MVIDYKGVTFSFKDQKRKKRFKRIRLIVIGVFILCLYVIIANMMDTGSVNAVQTLMLKNKPAEAAEKFEGIDGGFYHGTAKRELKALLLLLAGQPGKAGEILASMDTHADIVHFQKFLDFFSDRAQYVPLKIYTDYLLRVRGGEDLLIYKALYSTALFDFKGSRWVTSQLPAAEKEKHKQKLAILDRLNGELETGKLNYVFDVNGKPAAYYDLKSSKTVSLTPGMSFGAFEADFKKSTTFYSLTIDISLQEKLRGLFEKGNYHGTFLLLDLTDTSITAAYSRSLKGETENAVFSERYEPGSIIKVLTLFAYLRSGTPEIFPFQCKGSMRLGNRTFFDWRRHNTVKDFEEALAVSCNLSFARMGMNLGLRKFADVLGPFYFNGGDGLRDLFLEFKTGTFNKSAHDDFELANLSVGLGEVTTTTFHSAFIAAIIAVNGSVYSPYLIQNKKNLLNLGYYTHPAELLTVFTDNAAFFKVKRAMVGVVEHPEGTGKRSRVDFVQVGLKTGTTGDPQKGLDATLMGFFPEEKPAYAFAFRLERAGKAEIRGAYFLRDFLKLFYGK